MPCYWLSACCYYIPWHAPTRQACTHDSQLWSWMAGLHLHVRLHAHCTAAKAKPKQNNWALHYLAASHMHAACMPYACCFPGPQQLSYSRRATCTSDFAAREYEIDRSIDREDRTAALLAPTTVPFPKWPADGWIMDAGRSPENIYMHANGTKEQSNNNHM
jgi:hypothetical protein